MSTTASQLSSILEGSNERRHVNPRSRTNSTRERERGPLGEERASAWSSNNSKKTELYEVPVIKQYYIELTLKKLILKILI